MLLATVAADGPSTCSALPVARYSSESLSPELGTDFNLVGAHVEPNQTPVGTTQSFVFALFRHNRY